MKVSCPRSKVTTHLSLKHTLADNAGQFTSLDGSGGWVTKLDSRKIISVRGPDSQSFLQGLMTQDINLFRKDGADRAAIFTTFLNVKGKIIFDAILAKPLLANQREDDIEYWMEVANEDQEIALKHLKVNIDCSYHLEIRHKEESISARHFPCDKFIRGLDPVRCGL